jgi:hypothetical protein
MSHLRSAATIARPSRHPVSSRLNEKFEALHAGARRTFRIEIAYLAAVFY